MAKNTFVVIVSRADRAEFKIGIAAARSVSHSSLIALATAACSFATASSALTTLILIFKVIYQTKGGGRVELMNLKKKFYL